MGYQGRHRPGAKVVDLPPENVREDLRELRPVGRLRLLWAWLRARREVRAATRSTALVPRDAGHRPAGYIGRHEGARRVLAVSVRLERARRTDVRRPVSVAVVRGAREKTPARHACSGRAAYRRVAACRHRLGVDSTVGVATVLRTLSAAA